MPYNFKPCDRDQRFLLPVDMREWLPENHLALFIVDAVEGLDLSAFYASYRADGWGRAAFDPQMMVALVLYAFSVGERSTRRIERRCLEDIGFRVITAGDTPDHSTIARFIARHHDALEGLFAQVVAICARAGLVRPATVAIDGTKVAANASIDNTITEDQFADYARRVFEEAAEIDAEEDRLYGDRRGDEPPEFLRDRATRREWIREQLAEQQRKRDADAADPRTTHRRRKRTVRVNTTDPDSRSMKGARGFIQGYNAQAAVTDDQIIVGAEVTNVVDDSGHFQPMIKKAQDNLRSAGAAPVGTAVADAGYFSVANMEADLGCEPLIAPVATRHLAKRIADAPPIDPADINVQEPDPQERWEQVRAEDERRIETLGRVISGEITVTQSAAILGLSVPRASALKTMLQKQGSESIRRQVLPPAPRRPSPTDIALAKFARPEAQATYALRAIIAEPVFGQIKEARGFRKFLRRGLTGCNTEWTLVAITHNLRKAWAVTTRFDPSLLLRRLFSRLFPHPVAI